MTAFPVIEIDIADLNVSNTNISNNSDSYGYYCEPSEVKLYQDVALYLSIVITVLVVLLNSVVVGIIGRRRKLTRLYCYLLNLAIADLAAGLLDVLPRTLERAYNFMYLPDPYGTPLCKLQRGLGHTGLVTSNFILAAMSIDRAQVVTHPMRSFKKGKLLQCFIVLICWILGLACSIPITLLNNLLYGMCLENMEPYEFKMYWTFRLMIFFIVPVTIIIVSYTILIIGIHTRGINSAGGSDSSDSHAFNRRLPRSKLKSIKLTFGIILSFVICWTPYVLIRSLQTYANMIFCYIVLITGLRYLNCISNPIMFFVFHYKKQASVAGHSYSSDTLLGFLTSVKDRLKMSSTSSSLTTSSNSRKHDGLYQQQYNLVHNKDDMLTI